jgi:hypothetical protein
MREHRLMDAHPWEKRAEVLLAYLRYQAYKLLFKMIFATKIFCINSIILQPRYQAFK